MDKDKLNSVASALAYQRTVGADKRIEELEKEITELKSECRICVYTDSPCVRSDYPSKYGICSHYKNVFDENVELKKELKVLEGQTPWKDIKDKSEVIKQLTKAKDLLEKMYYLYFEPCVTHKDLENKDKLFEEVKQFIKE